jgi:hypothetical protein
MCDAPSTEMTSSFWLRSMLCTGALLSSCARGGVPATATLTSASTQANEVTREPPPRGHGHALVIAATSCWLGGLWSDAVGEKGDARDAGIRRRCDDILLEVGDSRKEPIAYAPLRALDARTVDRIADRVARAAHDDPREAPQASTLVALLRAVAAASRETVDARRAADKVKQVFETVPPGEEWRNKEAAAPELRHSAALHALLTHGGPYGEEARVIGTLDALDRVEIARGLPKHLKIYAVEGALLDMFGVSAPELSTNAAAPIKTGTWLTYLTKVAAAAGHPVPAEAKSPQNREPLAWNGVLEGIADRLRGTHTEPSLDAVTTSIVARIDQQSSRARAAFEAHRPSDR